MLLSRVIPQRVPKIIRAVRYSANSLEYRLLAQRIELTPIVVRSAGCTVISRTDTIGAIGHGRAGIAIMTGIGSGAGNPPLAHVTVSGDLTVDVVPLYHQCQRQPHHKQQDSPHGK